MHRLTALLARLLLAAPLLAFTGIVEAREVAVPIELDAELVRRMFVKQIYTSADGTAQLWDDESGCNFLTLSAPELEMRDGRVHLISPARARVGTPFLGKCLVVLDWAGFVEVVEEPRLERGSSSVAFRVVDSSLYGAKHERQFASSFLWRLAKDQVHELMATARIDLGAPLDDVRSFLPLFLPQESADRVDAILASLTLANLRATEAGIGVDLTLDVPRRQEPPPAESPTPEPTLSAEEVAAWQTAFESWDAFLTFVIKQAGDDATVFVLRQELFDVLLDARYDLVEALAPTAEHEEDPVRALFVRAWKRLAPVLRQVETGLPDESALRYVGFIAATDALAALDQLGPDLDIEISSSGLRRLARIVAPATTGDPLEFSFEVDPELRKLGGFGPPLETPPPNPDVDLSRNWLRRILDWLAPEAEAQDEAASLARLNRWVPLREELDEYLPLVRDLLNATVEEALAKRPLDTQYRQTYRWLVLATAWQESCWRQFIRKGDAIKPILSPVGAVGMMQVNQRVWRGLYDVNSLRGDIQYNARAGAEITMHYLADYAVKRGEHKNGLDSAARATYSIYNGGPGAMKRYRNPKASKGGKQIDASFWVKYQAVKAGREMDVALCWG